MPAPDLDTLRARLIRHYALLIAPAGIVLAAWAACRQLARVAPFHPEIIGPLAFIGAIVLALGAPILVRARFVRRVAASASVDADTFLAFEKGLLNLVLGSAYFAAAAYVCSATLFHFGGAFLAALYGAYYYYPTRTRVAAEARLFRVTGGRA
ncbi:MAG: hypothetical protein V3571_10255 [Pseudodesulfovibrio sp.]